MPLHRKLSSEDNDSDEEHQRPERILSQYTPTIHVYGEITQPLARRFVDALEVLTYERQSPAALIDIASDGGEYFALATMLSAMASSPMTLATFASGHAFSAAAVLLCAGKNGARFMSPYGAAMIHSIITAHAPQGMEEITGLTKFEEKLNKKLLALVARNCHMSLTKLLTSIRSGDARTLWLLPEQAKAIGLIDHIGIPSVTQEVTYGLEGLKV